MTRVLHVIDRSCDETLAQTLEALRARLNGENHRHTIIGIDPAAAARAAPHIHASIVLASRPIGPFYSPQRTAIGPSAAVELIHAWGVQAAAVYSARLPDSPLLVSLFDPEIVVDAADRIRCLPKPVAVVAGSQVVRSRLVTAGVSPEQVVVIRGPVDFGAINRARAAETRREIAGEATPVILLNGPPTRDGGQFVGLWAAAIVRELYPDLTVIMPYESREGRRLLRFARAIADRGFLTVPDPRLGWAELAACADVFLMPAQGEVCIEPLGTAMAAGLGVVGTAVRSIAEMIADGGNGLLCGVAEPKALAGRILTAIEDAPLRRKCTDAARAQAFEIFSARSFVENYTRLYDNIIAGRPPGENIHDTAMVA